MAIPKRVQDRLTAGIKKFQPILADAKSRDVGEAETVTIVKDMLAEIFGYDKYAEVTSERAIRGTYCDLATKIDGVLQALIEVKAIGLDLKELHVKQAIDYAQRRLAAFGGEYHTQKQALSRFCVGAMLTTSPVLEVIRRELRRVSPDVRIDTDQIKEVLSSEVI